MSKYKKKIAILTSGGDCSGLNAIIRAVFKRCQYYNWELHGIQEGLHGLLSSPPQLYKITHDSVHDMMFRTAGTILGTTNHGDPFAFKMPDGSIVDRSQEIINAFHNLHLDGLIAIGGDGSLQMISKLMSLGIKNIVAIPKTIDNDIGATEYSVGYNTALSIATEALDRLYTTAASHKRIMILEVMGRDAGHISLAAGIAGGADVILIPEVPYKIENIIKKIDSLHKRGQAHALIIIAEGVKTIEGKNATITHDNEQERYHGIGNYIAQKISEKLNIETRVSNLGHIQRGGIPTSIDRIIASAFGVYAVDLMATSNFGQMVTWHNHDVSHRPIQEAMKTYHLVKDTSSLLQTAYGLDICMG